MSKQQTEDFICYVIDRILDGKTEDVLPLINTDAEVHICLGNQLYSDSFSATFIGQSGMVNFLNLCSRFLDIIHFTPTEFHHENNKIIVRGDMEWQMPMTGSSWTAKWMQIWSLDKEKVSKLRMFSDFHMSAISDHLQTNLELQTATKH